MRRITVEVADDCRECSFAEFGTINDDLGREVPGYNCNMFDDWLTDVDPDGKVNPCEMCRKCDPKRGRRGTVEKLEQLLNEMEKITRAELDCSGQTALDSQGNYLLELMQHLERGIAGVEESDIIPPVRLVKTLVEQMTKIGSDRGRKYFRCAFMSNAGGGSPTVFKALRDGYIQITNWYGSSKTEQMPGIRNKVDFVKYVTGMLEAAGIREIRNVKRNKV